MGRGRRDDSERVGHRGQGGCVLREVGHIAKGLVTLAKRITYLSRASRVIRSTCSDVLCTNGKN